MNCPIQNDIQQLERFLKRFPQQASKLAISYLKSYLLLLSKYDSLVAQFQQLESNQPLTVTCSESEAQLTLAQQFRIETFARFIAQKQGDSEFWAVTFFHNYLILAEFYLDAQAEFDSLCASKRQPSLPH